MEGPFGTRTSLEMEVSLLERCIHFSEKYLGQQDMPLLEGCPLSGFHTQCTCTCIVCIFSTTLYCFHNLDQKYLCSVQNGRQPESSPNAIPDHLIDDTTVISEQSPRSEADSSHVPLLSSKSHDECGPTLNAAHHRTPSVSSNDSRGSVGSKRKKGRRHVSSKTY